VKETPFFRTDAESPEAILFGLSARGNQTATETLSELQQLARAGQFHVAGCVVQQRRTPDPRSYVGRGKLEELVELVEQTKAQAVICDDSLSPAQGRLIEQTLKVPVLDRSELILQIFASHARSRQAKLQVELAQLVYQLPRLKRLWTHLERQRGGIGLRGGAGEKQISLDRSDLRSRISQAKRKLKQIEERKSREVSSRADQFGIAIVGYTNAGKSTLMNRLTNAGVPAENQLFSTLDTRTRPWRLPGGRTVLLSDTVGFIDKLPHELVASFHATLEEALQADLLLVVLDASSPDAAKQLSIVEQVLDHLGAANIPQICILNKADTITDHSMLASIYAEEPNAVTISAITGDGIDKLEIELQAHLANCGRKVEILVPHSAGGLQGEIHRLTTVLSELYTPEGCLMECLVSPRLLGQILAKGARIHDNPPPVEPS